MTVAQRWRAGRASYRPAREVINTSTHEVALIGDDTTAKSFVVEHHYSRSYPAARVRAGLYHHDRLVGVAVFSVPVQPKVLDTLPGGRASSVELGRFVLLDSVAANGESWFLARCFELLRGKGFTAVASFSDPVPRVVDGHVLFPGHVGCIYQATNATYFGRSCPRTFRMLRNGRILPPRVLTKIRKLEQGHGYGEALLIGAGAAPRRVGEDPRDWVAYWVPRLTVRLRHDGQHHYGWALHPRDRKHLPKSQPYPKQVDPR